MTKQTEALKLALEALREIERLPGISSANLYARRAIKEIEALALVNFVDQEQPAHQHIEHCLWARNGNQPCPHVQPAQQEPIWFWTHPTYGRLYKQPPAQRTWAGLTDKEKREARNAVSYSPLAMTMGEWTEAVQDATEAKLKEKNT